MKRLIATIAALSIIAFLPIPVLGAGGVLHVDGKSGSDSNSGQSWASALKTISAAAGKVPREGAAAGWKVVVRGYADYVYVGRPVPGGYARWGTDGSPLVFQAEGWSPGGTDYVRPILSGAQSAPLAGKSWTNVGDGVWSTAWPTAPAQFSAGKPYLAAVFQNNETPLWQRRSLSDLRKSAKSDRLGGYWWSSGVLYVGPRGGSAPCPTGTSSLNCARISVPTSNGFYFEGARGAKHIEVRGFELRHFNVAIAFVGGTDHSAAYDNVVMGTSGAGIHVSGAKADPAVGNRIERNVGRLNTIQAIKVNAGSHGTRVCFNEAHDNGLQGIKVQGPFDGTSDPRITRDTLVCENKLHGQTFRRPDKPASYANGLTVSDGALSTTVRGNHIWNNAIGINLAQKGSGGKALDMTLIEGNLVWGNQGAGLMLNDGKKRTSSGAGRVTSHFNLYWANEFGIVVNKGSTRNLSLNDTLNANRRFGVRIGCKCSSVTADLRVEQSIISGSGRLGILVRSGGRATLAYLGLHGNKEGNLKGKVTVDPSGSVNTMPPGFLSTSPGSDDFLRISATSHQYTAGPGGTPIGARY